MYIVNLRATIKIVTLNVKHLNKLLWTKYVFPPHISMLKTNLQCDNIIISKKKQQQKTPHKNQKTKIKQHNNQKTHPDCTISGRNANGKVTLEDSFTVFYKAMFIVVLFINIKNCSNQDVLQ